jgi:predicted DCC family thiol-disulfide oxidoreductase YuxK
MTDIVEKTTKKAQKEFLPDPIESLPVISEPRCRICRSEFRPLIDRMIAGPYSYAAIARQFKDKDAELSGSNHEALRKSIERHAKQHVTVRDQAVREIIEQRAIERGILVDEQKNMLLTSEALLELYVQKGFEQITKDGTWVRHQDVLEAVKMVEEMRRDTTAEQVEALKKQVQVISLAVREIVPADLHPAIVERAKELMEQPVIDMPVVQNKREAISA